MEPTKDAQHLQPRYKWRARGLKRHTVQDERDETLAIAIACSIVASACTVLLMKIVEVV